MAKTSAGDEKAKEERGPKSPALSVGAAAQLLRQVREGVGFGRASRETVIRALGYNSPNGRSNRVLAALLHYGLLERSGDAAVQISALGKQVLLPRDEIESTKALADAAARPILFKKLIARFHGHGLPTLFPNILVREFGVMPGSSEEVAKVFRESMMDAGLLRNGVLFETLDESASEESADNPPDESLELPVRKVDPSSNSISREKVDLPAGQSQVQRYVIALDLTGRVAAIDIPVPVTQADLRRITHWVDYMLPLVEAAH